MLSLQSEKVFNRMPDVARSSKKPTPSGKPNGYADVDAVT